MLDLFFNEPKSSSTFESDSEYTIELEVPGFSNDNISVEVLPERLLKIKAEKSSGRKLIEKYWRLPSTIDADNISAIANHGLLTVKLPKKASENVSRKIAVRTE